MNIYHEIYHLIKDVGFSPEYIESIIPLERSLFWQYHIEVQNKRKAAQANNGEAQQFNALSDDLPVDRMKQDGLMYGG